MRTVSDEDLTGRAAIRNAALELFAAHGPDAVTVRQIAAAAGVSPALVLNHFGSKAGLRAAVDDHVASIFDALLTAGGDTVAEDLVGGEGASLVAAFADIFPVGSPLPAYLRQLLISGGPTGQALFARWLAGVEEFLAGMERAGLAGPSDDPTVRAAFLLVNDLAVVLLREQLNATLGFDPLSPAGVERWGAEVTSAYATGVWKGARR